MRAHAFAHLRQSFLRRVTVWVLVLALPINGLSNMLLQILGPQHHHVAAPASWSLHTVLEEVIGQQAMAIIDAVHARQQQGPQDTPVRVSSADFYPYVQAHEVDTPSDAHPHPHPHVHTHGAFERHHHDSQDGSVVPTGPTGTGHDGPGSAQTSLDISAASPIPFITSIAVLMAAAGPATWDGPVAARWHDHVSAPLERPPRA